MDAFQRPTPAAFRPETPADLALAMAEATGVRVRFFQPDGLPFVGDSSAAGSPPETGPARGAPPEGLARLAREAGRAADVRFDTGPAGPAAAWPVCRRGRPVLVAAARLPDHVGPDTEARRAFVAALERWTAATFDLAAVRGESDATAESLAQSYEEISLLHGLGEVLRVNRPIDELLQDMCEELRAVIGAGAAAAYLPEAAGLGPACVVAGTLPMSATDLPRLVRHVLEMAGPEHSVVVDNHCQDDPFLAGLSMRLEQLVLVPLPLADGATGAMAAFNREGDEFGSPEAKLTRSVTASGAVFIENRRLYGELHELMLDLVRALVSSIDAKDPYTCGHSERVAITSRALAEHLGCDDDFAEQAYLAGLLHDIGKIGTPEQILRKDGRLVPEEREIVSRHPVTGSRILEGIRRLQEVRQAVLHHHEWYDGTGYPEGVAGDRIPYLARIVGLADAFDAMTSNRPYRPMLELDHVLREVEGQSGTQFDPAAVAALLELDVPDLMRRFAERPTTVCAQVS